MSMYAEVSGTKWFSLHKNNLLKNRSVSTSAVFVTLKHTYVKILSD